MTIASELIRRAFRQENLTAIGKSPTSAEQTEALEILNDLINQLFGFEIGEVVFEWQVPPTRTSTIRKENPNDPFNQRESTTVQTNPPQNVRLVTNLTDATTLYLPEYPSNGARITLAEVASTNTNLTLDANGKSIEDAPTLAVDLSSVTEREWFYRADTANWLRRTQLALSDESLFPVQHDQLFITGLAIALAPRHGKEPKPVTTGAFISSKSRFEAVYKQEVPTQGTYNLNAIQSRNNSGSTSGRGGRGGFNAG